MTFAQLQAHATNAQKIMARHSGMSETASGNFVGPDGRIYTMLFRAADALEVESAAREMTAHGYTDRSVVIATATRTQFPVPPLDWRRKKGTRTAPGPDTECLIHSINTDDPLHYVFVLLIRQAAN